MPAASLFGQVGCLPGRLYAARTDLIKDRMDELVNDTFSYFGFQRKLCVAGDDRAITNFVLEAGYRTILMPKAQITTDAPATFQNTLKMWARWGRSSQGYTIRSKWLWKRPAAFLLYWSDILLTVFTVFIVAIHWPYAMFFGNSGIPFFQALFYALLGMMATMFIRQSPHLCQYRYYFKLLPVFTVVATIAQFTRFWSLCTQHKIGSWGTRSQAPAAGGNVVKVIACK
jgi:cellulose synthase/poly-beta-1,6-N-acetylglucosamine synthase-like glycosyltransferase